MAGVACRKPEALVSMCMFGSTVLRLGLITERILYSGVTLMSDAVLQSNLTVGAWWPLPLPQEGHMVCL